MVGFEYRRAHSVDEAVRLLASAGDARLLAGGMTLIPALKHRLCSPQLLVDIGRIESLRTIEGQTGGKGAEEVQGAVWRVGAAVRHAELAAHPGMRRQIPALCALASGIGDPQVRARGTVGGSLANNDPAADYPAAVLGVGARIHTNLRTIPADAFFQGMFTTLLEEHEILTGVEFPVPRRAGYCKFPHPATGYAMAGVFVAELSSGTVRVAVTGVAQGVFRWQEAESALQRGERLPALVREDLLNDMHASGPYRAHMAQVMLQRAVDAWTFGKEG